MSTFEIFTRVNVSGVGKAIGKESAELLIKDLDGNAGVRRFVEDLDYPYRPENLVDTAIKKTVLSLAPKEVEPEKQINMVSVIQNLKDHIIQTHFPKCQTQVNLLLAGLMKIDIWSKADNPRALLVDHKKGALSETVKLVKLMYGHCGRFGDLNLLGSLLYEFGFDQHSHYIHTKKGKIRIPTEANW